MNSLFWLDSTTPLKGPQHSPEADARVRAFALARNRAFPLAICSRVRLREKFSSYRVIFLERSLRYFTSDISDITSRWEYRKTDTHPSLGAFVMYRLLWTNTGYSIPSTDVYLLLDRSIGRVREGGGTIAQIIGIFRSVIYSISEYDIPSKKSIFF
jgi:hypothetical protein